MNSTSETTIGQTIARVVITDKDLPPNNQSQLFISRGNEDGLFKIDGQGRVTVQVRNIYLNLLNIIFSEITRKPGKPHENVQPDAASFRRSALDDFQHENRCSASAAPRMPTRTDHHQNFGVDDEGYCNPEGQRQFWRNQNALPISDDRDSTIFNRPEKRRRQNYRGSG